MRFMVENKIIYLLLLFLCFLSNACAQSEEGKKSAAYDYEKKAFEYRKSGNLKEALDEQLKAIELNPSRAESYIVLSSIYQDMKDLQKAIESAKKAVNLSPNNNVAYYVLADSLREAGNKQQAVEAFQEAIRLAPEDTNALINLGITYEDLNDKISARQSYEKALAVDSNYVPAIYLLGELESEDGNTDKSIELFKKAAEIKIPENRQAEQSNSQQDAKRRLQELETKKKSSTQKKP